MVAIKVRSYICNFPCGEDPVQRKHIPSPNMLITQRWQPLMNGTETGTQERRYSSQVASLGGKKRGRDLRNKCPATSIKFQLHLKFTIGSTSIPLPHCSFLFHFLKPPSLANCRRPAAYRRQAIAAAWGRSKKGNCC